MLAAYVARSGEADPPGSRPSTRCARLIRRSVLLTAATTSAALVLAAGLASCSSGTGNGVSGLSASDVPFGRIPGTRVMLPTPAELGKCPWLDPRLPVGKRVGMLLARMTLKQKIAIMHPTTTRNGQEGYLLGMPSLCIPSLTSEDDSAGVGGGAVNVTQLPDPQVLAQTWDPQLSYEYGQLNAKEHWGQGVGMIFGPTINIDRVPVWGRSFETYSEDPYLTAQLGVANVEGIQSEGMMAQVKHFALYNQETHRNTASDNVIVSERALQEIYLPAWRAVVEQASPASIMCSYSHPNGQFACNDHYLLTNVLRDTYHFSGFVGSDYGATHATAASANAGLNFSQLGLTQSSSYYDLGQLYDAVKHHRVSVSTIDTLVGEILSQMFRFGLFDRRPTGSSSSSVDTPSHAAFARKVAEEGTVLLRNEGGLLPLGSSAGSVAVIGSDAGESAVTATPAISSAHVNAPFIVTPCDGIKAVAPHGVAVTCDTSDDPTAASRVARASRFAIVFVSNLDFEGMDDATSMALSATDTALVEAVATANPRTIVVLNSGTPVTMPWLGSVAGVIYAGYPGEEDGTAIASVIFGQTNPSGHLTITFPTSYSESPVSSPAQFPGVGGNVDYSEGIFVGYRYYDEHDLVPLFPFGFGLSYTTFSFSHLLVSRGGGNGGGDTSGTGGSSESARAGSGRAGVQSTGSPTVATVSAQVTNTGRTAGSDVVQLYVGDPASTGEPPLQLKGFQRVTLARGQSEAVTFHLDARSLAYFQTSAGDSSGAANNSTAGTWTDAPGTYRVYVGDSSALVNLPLQDSFTLAQSTNLPAG